MVENDKFIWEIMILRLATLEGIGTPINLRLQMLREIVGSFPEELPNSIQTYLEKHISDKSCLCALLEIDGKIVAMAMLCCYEEMPDEISLEGKSAKLSSVYTLPSFRSRGYMEQLLLYLMDEARNCSIGEIYAAAERKAMPLYKRVGFQAAETIMFMDI